LENVKPVVVEVKSVVVEVKPVETTFCSSIPPVEAEMSFMDGFTPEASSKMLGPYVS